ncbi:hypothetical protein PO124_05890 [Bacillus licheniformis]|nr:hypothetical protein [Bacillus licheniformis]
MRNASISPCSLPKTKKNTLIHLKSRRRLQQTFPLLDGEYVREFNDDIGKDASAIFVRAHFDTMAGSPRCKRSRS